MLKSVLHGATLLIISLATPAKADTPVLVYEFPKESFVFPIDLLIEAKAIPMTSGEQGLVATFAPELSQGPVTARNVGTKAIVRICGEDVSRPLILSEISGSTVMLPLDNPDDAPRLAATLNARKCTEPSSS
ncbi:MAG: hypothetical protein C0427_02755 [Rhodobacter sp.]|nr:hypothetical protein [Rhodobacter sp.]